VKLQAKHEMKHWNKIEMLGFYKAHNKKRTPFHKKVKKQECMKYEAPSVVRSLK